MKTIILHGLGQTPRDWEEVLRRLPFSDVECPALFSLSPGCVTYPRILAELEKQCAEETERVCLCGLSMGAVLALEHTIRHGETVDSLILIGAQYQVPDLLIGFQNLIFHCMPDKAFSGMGLSKHDTIRLARSMRGLNLSKSLYQIRCPVTIVCGEKDHANLRASKRLKKLLPQAELQIIPGAGHEINKDAPEAAAAVLARSLRKEDL